MSDTMTTTRSRRRFNAVRTLSDEELVSTFQISRGNDAVSELLRRYEGTVHNVAKRYFVPGGDHDDVRQQAMIGFWKAVRDFTPGAGSRFPGFAQSCMQRQVITAVKAANRKKHAPLTVSDRIAQHDAGADADRPSVNTQLPQTSHEASVIDRLLLSGTDAAPIDLTEIETLVAVHGPEAVHEMVVESYIGDDRAGRRRRKGEAVRLTENELHVLVGLISGAKYRELADRLDVTDKYVDNTVQRLRTKMRELLGD